MKQFYPQTIFLLVLLAGFTAQAQDSISLISPYIADNGDGTYNNPILMADYSDPDVVKVGDDFYMTASSFNCSPGLPILHSRDLVNWEIIGHVFEQQMPTDEYDTTRHGQGVWAPSIRYHDNEFYIYWGNPDFGIYCAKATDPAGPWTVHLVQQAKGWIDACPLWDDNGDVWLIHAWANSRSGVKSVLTLRKMAADGLSLPGDTITVYDNRSGADPDGVTVEGPKMYKRNGYYYIFAPAGGVTEGWQLVFRADSLQGPYTYKKTLHQGSTLINGPHQGGWVELASGESWFIHFQDKGVYGRVTHLQPVEWVDDWPLMGTAIPSVAGDSIGEPVLTFTKPDVGATYPVVTPPSSDNFSDTTLGLQWQWHANQQDEWFDLSANPGYLRLHAAEMPAVSPNMAWAPHILGQKIPSLSFRATAKMVLNFSQEGEMAGLMMMGESYSHISVAQTATGPVLSLRRCNSTLSGDFPNDNEEFTVSNTEVAVPGDTVYLRINFEVNPFDPTTNRATHKYAYSFDGVTYTEFPTRFTPVEGKWIGGKITLFCQRPNGSAAGGYVDVDWIEVGPESVLNAIEEELNPGFRVNAFPNPTKGGFTVNLDSEQVGLADVDLLNLYGQQVAVLAEKRQIVPGSQVFAVADMNLAPGLYLIRTRISGQASFTKIWIE